jgi:hypothetical protein
VVVRKFEILSQDYRSGGASFLAIPTKNAANHVYFVSRGVPLPRAESRLIGILGGFDENAPGWASPSTQRTPYAFL